ncbi:MAG: OmpA family protein [Pseudomonadota bacterium]
MKKKLIENLPWIAPSAAILLAASGYFDRPQVIQTQAVPAPVVASAAVMPAAVAPTPAPVQAEAQPVVQPAPVEPAAAPVAVDVTRNAPLTANFGAVAATTPEVTTPEPVTPASVAVSPTENAAAFFGAAQARLAEAKSCVDDLRALTNEARVYFPSGGLTGEASGVGQARLIGLVAQNCPGVTIQVEGHSDPSGDPRVNLRLSQERAEAIIARLAAANIDTSRFVAIGMGDREPSTVTGPESRAYYDRRVEFSVIEGATTQQASFTPQTTTKQWQLSACAADLQRAVAEAKVFYTPGSVIVSQTDMQTAYDLVTKATACPQARLRVVGQHADGFGSIETTATGRLRAVAMMTSLVGAGFDSGQIIIGAPSRSNPLPGQGAQTASRVDFDVILEDG